ncbi:coiled-coil domain-containing protein 126 [Neoarius graeffei]|uniref:coiled-coil domain-containing protein 126 n=1 Tax=Neoarius graeffei TaxID=443677 RepID=UPI00298C29E6|nr:coiled-coil domain-containing protein 126 [Neoarius graeffei]
MLSCLLRGRSMSQRLSILLLLFGLAWCLLLLHYTVTQPRHQSSAELRQQILELSQRYVKALSTENQHLARSYNPSMAGYADLKRTIAVLLDDILNRLVKLENRLDATVNTSVHSPSHVTGTVLHRTTKQNESGTNANNNQIQPQPQPLM